ncbi:putative sulfate exporter family transporter [Microtetraspora sp. NBRC 16547]|uniref:YeiH family protein n=1 Tax=Microtetraspora sp. NBRC 16547 TaxID=3030993 RepID=UPI0024A575CC|nr:putative sulfate exporter family transporter [Microtetraspora sp. NBRC 16547]GLX00180.1 membrane protein [Microtetraspora sp. NBRC 16547]
MTTDERTAPRALSSWVVPLLPGLALTVAAVVLAVMLNRLVPAVGTLTGAILLGVAAANTGLIRPSARAGTRFAAKQVLRAGVVLLGLQLAVSDVLGLGGPMLGAVVIITVATFLGTRWLGARMGVPPGQSLLIATGTAVCGAAAIAAMNSVSDSDEEDVAAGIGLVTICGTLAIFAMPLLREPLGLDPEMFGAWAGASIHEVSQVVATAAAVPGAMAAAVVVKLTRVALLAPLLAGVGIARRRAGTAVPGAARPPIVPLFVVGFLAMVAVRSTGLIPPAPLEVIKTIDTWLLAAAMFGLGTGVHLASLRRTGLRALALGFASWLLIGVLAYAGVQIAL